MARGLGPLERAGDEQPIGSDDLLDLSHSTRGASRFLGIYGPDGALAAMRAHGLVARLEAMGFRHVGIELDCAPPSTPRCGPVMTSAAYATAAVEGADLGFALLREEGEDEAAD